MGMLAEWLTKILTAVLGSPSECLDRLVTLITTGRLGAEFKADPFGVLCCVFSVAAEFCCRLAGDHDHVKPIGSDGPDPFTASCVRAADALGVVVPAEGPLSGLLLKLVLSQLLDELVRIIKEALT